MFRLENATYLWLWIILPIFAFGFWYFIKENTLLLKKWGNDEIVKSLTKGLEVKYSKVRYVIWLCAFGIAVFGLANPQWGFNNEELKRNAGDVYIALDISRSMDVQDIPPSRLIRAKKYAIDLIQSLKGNNIGIILFAESAYMQIPLTNDYAAAIMMINAASTDLAGSQGTNIKAVADLIKKTNEKQDNATGHLILITDGEDHEGDAIEAIKLLTDEGFTSYCVAAGTKEGGYIAEGNGYKMDEMGKPIVSKINVELINDIAKVGNGRAFGVEDGKSIETISEDIANGAKSEKTTKTFNQYNSYFQWFVFLSLLLFIAEFIFEKWYYLKKLDNNYE